MEKRFRNHGVLLVGEGNPSSTIAVITVERGVEGLPFLF